MITWDSVLSSSQNVEGVQVKAIRNGSVSQGRIPEEEISDGGHHERIISLTHNFTEPSHERTHTALTHNLTVVQKWERVVTKRLKI